MIKNKGDCNEYVIAFDNKLILLWKDNGDICRKSNLTIDSEAWIYQDHMCLIPRA